MKQVLSDDYEVLKGHAGARPGLLGRVPVSLVLSAQDCRCCC